MLAAISSTASAVHRVLQGPCLLVDLAREPLERVRHLVELLDDEPEPVVERAVRGVERRPGPEPAGGERLQVRWSSPTRFSTSFVRRTASVPSRTVWMAATNSSPSYSGTAV
jgi:hypothetical protein